MATNKNAQLRYNVIDQCLSNFQRTYTYEGLLQKVNNVLEENAYEGIKTRQLKEDLRFMQSLAGFAIELEEDLFEGKKRILRYKNKGFSIAQHPLNQLDQEQLNATITILSRYKHRIEFAWLEELIPRMKDAFQLVELGQEGLISYQENPDLKGLAHLGQLFNCIAQCKTLRITYQAFYKEAQELNIHPYHLKQYNNRWFLMAKTEGFEQVSTYALDRIVSLEETSVNFIPTTINWLDYFDEIVGVSKPINAVSEKIRLRVFDASIDYVKTKPLHGTQKIISANKGVLELQLEVIPNKELMQLILSFGATIEVIEPSNLREEISHEIEALKKIY